MWKWLLDLCEDRPENHHCPICGKPCIMGSSGMITCKDHAVALM